MCFKTNRRCLDGKFHGGVIKKAPRLQDSQLNRGVTRVSDPKPLRFTGKVLAAGLVSALACVVTLLLLVCVLDHPRLSSASVMTLLVLIQSRLLVQDCATKLEAEGLQGAIQEVSMIKVP